MNEGERTESERRERFPSSVSTQTPLPLFAPGDPVPNLEMWTLVRKLGGGGFGEVWLARHDRKGEAAVKFCTDSKARHKLVTHEKVVVARVMKHGGNHPNIVPMLECNLSGDIPWLMYEYVEGGTLEEAVAQWRELSPPRRLGRAVRVLHAVSTALSRFHRLDPPLVHRDLKPQNILMMAGQTPRITDFGIGGAAREANPTNPTDPNDPGSGLAVRVPTFLQTAGSSQYAPHEQFLGAPPSPRDDVFALGVIGYQLVLADLKAIPSSDAASVLRALRIPSELSSLIVRSVALDPEKRPKDAGEWEEKLGALVKKKTAASKPSLPALPPVGDGDEATEELEPIGDSDPILPAPPRTLALASRGRWYCRPADQPNAEWALVTKTPATLYILAGEAYRFSIQSTATEKDVAGIIALAGITSLHYLNLSFCPGVTDAGLELVKALTGLRQLYLRGSSHITDAGLIHLHTLMELRTLDLTDCQQLSGAAVADLQSALPACKILH
jgi:serine/threonine protein kinase